MKKKKHIILWVLGLLLLTVTACSNDNENAEGANSEENEGGDFPEDTVRMTIPWGSGGNADLFARKVADLMEDDIDQSTVVENETGAGGEAAITNYAKEQPDYHSLLTTSASDFALTPKFKDVQYSQDDFKPVIGSFFSQFVLMVNSDSGIESLEDLKEYGEENGIKYGSTSGPGGDTQTILAALFADMGVEAENVQFDGGQELVNNLLGDHVDVSLGIQPLADEYFENGELTPLATFSPEPYELDGIDPVPPLTEQGYDITYRSLNFVNAPKDTPDEVIDQINEEFNKVYEKDEFKEYVEEEGFLLEPMDGEEVTEFIEEQSEEMEKLLDIIEKEED